MLAKISTNTPVRSDHSDHQSLEPRLNVLSPHLGGAWIDDHPLPSGKSRYGSFDQLQENNNIVVQRILAGGGDLKDAVDNKVRATIPLISTSMKAVSLISPT